MRLGRGARWRRSGLLGSALAPSPARGSGERRSVGVLLTWRAVLCGEPWWRVVRQISMTKHCGKCETTKPVAEFYKNKSTGERADHCRECTKQSHAATMAAWDAAITQRMVAFDAEFYGTNGEYWAASRAFWDAAKTERRAVSRAAWYAAETPGRSLLLFAV